LTIKDTLILSSSEAVITTADGAIGPVTSFLVLNENLEYEKLNFNFRK